MSGWHRLNSENRVMLTKLTFDLDDGSTLAFETEDFQLIIGRSSKCNIVIPAEGVSRKHCSIELGEVWTITDLESRAGVLLNNEKITPGLKIPFREKQRISFGPVRLLTVESLMPKEARAVVKKPVHRVKLSWSSVFTIAFPIILLLGGAYACQKSKEMAEKPLSPEELYE